MRVSTSLLTRRADCSALYSRAVQRFIKVFLALTLAIVLQSPARSAPDALDAFLRSRAPQGRGGRGNVALPDGTGKAQVEAYCSTCHQLGNIVNSGGYTREGWQQLIATMIALPKEQGDVVVEYLAKNFPEQPKPTPVLLAGDTKVAFKEWNLPTLGSRPHDPWPPDGAIHRTAQSGIRECSRTSWAVSIRALVRSRSTRSRRRSRARTA